MIVKQDKPFEYGFTTITEQHERHSELLLDFGILKMKTGDSMDLESGRERMVIQL